MEHWIFILINSESIPLLTGISYEWESLRSWSYAEKQIELGQHLASTWGTSQPATEWCSETTHLLKPSAKVLSTVLPASQTHWGQSISPSRWLGPSQNYPSAVYIFRECLKDEETSSKQHVPNVTGMICSALEKRSPRCLCREACLPEMNQDPINGPPCEHSYLLVLPNHKHRSKSLRNYAICLRSQNKSNAHHILC